MKTVTLILPTFNGARYLSSAIQSILDQTYPCIELIAVNDGSTDRTQEIIDGYSTLAGPRLVRIWQPNRGKAAAINHALQKASGAYIAVIDDDDRLPSESIARRSDFLSCNPGILTVYGDSGLIDARDREYGIKRSRMIKSPREMVSSFRNPIASCSPMFRRKAMDSIQSLDEQIKRLDDIDRHIMLFRAGPMAYIPEIVAYFRTYPRNDFDKSNTIPERVSASSPGNISVFRMLRLLWFASFFFRQ